jgi:hypothetical protein
MHRLLWKAKFHYRVKNSVLSQLNLVQTFLAYSFKINFNTILYYYYYYY